MKIELPQSVFCLCMNGHPIGAFIDPEVAESVRVEMNAKMASVESGVFIYSVSTIKLFSSIEDLKQRDFV